MYNREHIIDNLLKLDSESDKENVQKAMIESMSNQNPYVHGTIDDLILEAIHAHNTFLKLIHDNGLIAGIVFLDKRTASVIVVNPA